MKFAAIFPGQGSQSQGMLAELAGDYPVVMATFAEASEVLGYDLWTLVQDNPEDALGKTVHTQPAMLAAGVAAWRAWCEFTELRPEVLAGHSLGEYSALVAANALDFTDAVRLVEARARLMQQAVPEGEGAMAAILGLDDDAVRKVCNYAAEGGVVEAVNFNAPGQIVIAGETEAVERATAAAKAEGARRALILPVSVPSHSSLMIPAAEKLAEHLDMVAIRQPEIPVIQNVDAKIADSADAIRDALVRQLYSPVRWVASVQAMQVDAFIEMGPGKVLAGLAKRIRKGVPVACVDSSKMLANALDTVGVEA